MAGQTVKVQRDKMSRGNKELSPQALLNAAILGDSFNLVIVSGDGDDAKVIRNLTVEVTDNGNGDAPKGK